MPIQERGTRAVTSPLLPALCPPLHASTSSSEARRLSERQRRTDRRRLASTLSQDASYTADCVTHSQTVRQTLRPPDNRTGGLAGTQALSRSVGKQAVSAPFAPRSPALRDRDTHADRKAAGQGGASTPRQLRRQSIRHPGTRTLEHQTDYIKRPHQDVHPSLIPLHRENTHAGANVD